MIYDLVESAAADLTANFGTYMAAVIASKTGLPGGTVATATVYKRQPAEIFAAIPGNVLPGLGVYAAPGGYPGVKSGVTQAKSTGTRKSMIQLALDYFFRGPDPALAVLQAELAVEALLKHVDALYTQPGVVGAGEAPGSVSIELFDVKAAGEDYYEQRVLVIAPADTWDTGL